MTFPKLKTNAVAQYPAARALQFRTQILRFLDGNEQRYADSGGALHRWVVRLSELDEHELSEMDMFFCVNQGQYGTFAFTDPWDGTEYANCSFADDQLDLLSTQPVRCQTTLTVVENRT